MLGPKWNRCNPKSELPGPQQPFPLATSPHNHNHHPNVKMSNTGGGEREELGSLGDKQCVWDFLGLFECGRGVVIGEDTTSQL